MVKVPKPKLIVLKIDGTTTPREFILDVMLPYAQNNMSEYLQEHWADDDVMKLISYLRQESDLDSNAPSIKNQRENDGRLLRETLEYLKYLMKGRKSTIGLQLFYLLIWGDGYDRGQLRSQVYPDVADAMYAWHVMKIPIVVFGGGCAVANRMIFTFSQEGGNLNKFVREYLEPSKIGNRREEESYEKIANRFSIKTKELLFLTDDPKEAMAAREARCRCVIVKRPNNPAVSQDELNEIGCSAVSSFLEVFFDG